MAHETCNECGNDDRREGFDVCGDCQERRPALRIASPRQTAGGNGRRLVIAEGIGTIGAVRMRSRGAWQAFGAAKTRADLIGEYASKEAAAEAAFDHYTAWKSARRLGR